MDDETFSPVRLIGLVFIYFFVLFVLFRLVFALGVIRPEGREHRLRESDVQTKVTVSGGKPSSRLPNATSPRRQSLSGPLPTAVEVKTDRGTFSISLDWEKAKSTSANFVILARKGFYDGTTFHIATKTEVVGGDPNSRDADPGNDGAGGPGYTIVGELNLRPNLDGAVGMVRPGGPDSAGSQFYICRTRLKDRDGRYAVFGQVYKGLDVAHKLQKYDRIISMRVMP